MPLQLIGSHASPYTRKVRVVLAEKNIPFEFTIGDVMAEDSPIFQFNPLGKIPCLVLEDGTPLYDSAVIAEYLDALSDRCPLIPAHPRLRADVRCWEALANGVLDAGILVRWEAHVRESHLRDASWTQRQNTKISHALATMSEQLGEQRFCMGDVFTLADIAVGSTLGWLLFRFPELDWPSQLPNLASLHQRLLRRPSFSNTLPRV
ncbi:glutathione S-transferase family protein [uncultured Comamonas sp.]|uniref:glutathione S-transferase family protein n=1 Tax=uncultured Comamonas sp. TaxID=114710 RepID=UPI003748F89E